MEKRIVLVPGVGSLRLVLAQVGMVRIRAYNPIVQAAVHQGVVEAEVYCQHPLLPATHRCVSLDQHAPRESSNVPIYHLPLTAGNRWPISHPDRSVPQPARRQWRVSCLTCSTWLNAVV